MSMQDQGAKPTGLTGKIIGKMMNAFHTSFYIQHFKKHVPEDNSQILDIGCGGGKFLKSMALLNDSYLLTGFDHSSEMVDLAKQVNKKFVDIGRMTISQGSVINMSFDEKTFDLVTALETIQFWPETSKSIANVFRILKPGGRFVIINRYPKENTKWWKMAKIKSEAEYSEIFKQAGFVQVNCELEEKKGWIVVEALKKEF